MSKDMQQGGGEVCTNCKMPKEGHGWLRPVEMCQCATITSPPSAPVGVSDDYRKGWDAGRTMQRALAQQPAAVDEDVRELLDAMDSGRDPRPAFLRLRKRFPATQHQEPTT